MRGAYVNLFDFGEGASIEVDVFTETTPSRTDHGGERVDDELRAAEIRWCLGETDRGELEQDEDVIAQYRLHGRLSKVVDLFGFAKVGRVGHYIKLSEPRAS